jgi:hypothetical protein
VQRELSRVTQELEAKEATLQRLASSASLSTLQVALNQRPDRLPPPPPPPTWSLRRTVGRAGRWLRHVLTRLVDVAVFAAVAAVPLALAVAGLALGARVAGRPLWAAAALCVGSLCGSSDGGRHGSSSAAAKEEK